MLKFCASIIGIVLLIGGVVLLFFAQGPSLKNVTRDLGGANVTQEEIAQQTFGGTFSDENRPDLPVFVDGEPMYTNSIGAQPELSSAALSDVSSVDSAEQEQAPAMNVATDPINKDNQVDVVPLSIQSFSGFTTSGQGGAGGAGQLVQRVVEFEYPESFRIGRSEGVRFKLKSIGGGQIIAIPEIQDNAIIATPILLSDYHDTHNAYFTARLVAPDVEVTLLTNSEQLVGRYEETTWRWNIKAPESSGTFVMSLFLDVRWDPKPGTSGTVYPTRAVWNQAIQADVDYVFGLVTVPQASILGSALAFVGFVSQVPSLTTIAAFIFTSRRNRSKKSRRR